MAPRVINTCTEGEEETTKMNRDCVVKWGLKRGMLRQGQSLHDQPKHGTVLFFQALHVLEANYKVRSVEMMARKRQNGAKRVKKNACPKKKRENERRLFFPPAGGKR